jgi:TPR repeat protein
MSDSTLQKSHYFTYLETKSLPRSIIATIPVLGNLALAVFDVYCFFFATRADEIASHASLFTQPKDNCARLKWYKKAARRGSVEALYQLGCAARDGRGAKQDPIKAVHLFRLAAARLHEKALKDLQEITKN